MARRGDGTLGRLADLFSQRAPLQPRAQLLDRRPRRHLGQPLRMDRLERRRLSRRRRLDGSDAPRRRLLRLARLRRAALTAFLPGCVAARVTDQIMRLKKDFFFVDCDEDREEEATTFVVSTVFLRGNIF